MAKFPSKEIIEQIETPIMADYIKLGEIDSSNISYHALIIGINNYDNSIGRLNTESRGEYLGKFNGDDMIIVLYKDGNYELTSFELTNRFWYSKFV